MTGDTMRESEVYGDVKLSVQASWHHYCTPCEGDASTPLDHYESVEVSIPSGRRHLLPSALGIQGFDHLFQGDEAPVAGYMDQADVERLRDALRARAKKVSEVGARVELRRDYDLDREGTWQAETLTVCDPGDDRPAFIEAWALKRTAKRRYESYMCVDLSDDERCRIIRALGGVPQDEVST